MDRKLAPIVAIVATVAVFALRGASFEVASIKPARPESTGAGVDMDNGLLRMRNVTLKRCIMRAWGIPEVQISGDPKWIDDVRFDIDARTDPAASSDEVASMLQALLSDRFHLSFHRATRMMSGYSLVVAKGGIRAKVSAPDTVSGTDRSPGRIEGTACSMPKLAARLAAVLEAPVKDMTDIPGNFDFILQWTADDTRPGAAPPELPQGPSLFTALREQLGLRLESRKIPAEVLVIDGARLPSEN